MNDSSGPTYDLTTERLIAEECARTWGIDLDPPFDMSNFSYVAPTTDGAVLKVAWSGDDESLHEAEALEVWNGDGAVRVLRRSGRTLLEERAIPGDDAGEPEPPRLRLAHGARIAGAPLDSRARGGREANQLLHSSGHAYHLCDLSLLARLPRSPRDLHHPARAAENPKTRMRPAQMPTFRIAVSL